MNIKILALVLLIEHLASTFFIVLVLIRQIKLFKIPIIDELRQFRRVLFFLATAIFAGNLVPITIDILTLLADLRGRSNPSVIGITYAISNATTAIASGFFIWFMYKMAADEKASRLVRKLFLASRRRDLYAEAHPKQKPKKKK